MDEVSFHKDHLSKDFSCRSLGLREQTTRRLSPESSTERRISNCCSSIPRTTDVMSSRNSAARPWRCRHRQARARCASDQQSDSGTRVPPPEAPKAAARVRRRPCSRSHGRVRAGHHRGSLFARGAFEPPRASSASTSMTRIRFLISVRCMAASSCCGDGPVTFSRVSGCSQEVSDIYMETRNIRGVAGQELESSMTDDLSIHHSQPALCP